MRAIEKDLCTEVKGGRYIQVGSSFTVTYTYKICEGLKGALAGAFFGIGVGCGLYDNHYNLPFHETKDDYVYSMIILGALVVGVINYGEFAVGTRVAPYVISFFA